MPRELTKTRFVVQSPLWYRYGSIGLGTAGNHILCHCLEFGRASFIVACLG